MIARSCPHHGPSGRCDYCRSETPASWLAKHMARRPAPPARDAVGPRRFRSTPTTRDGIRFASKGEAALYDKAKATGAIVVPHVRFPLHVLTTDGQPATWFTPDLVVMVAGGDYGDGATMHNVEAWECKPAGRKPRKGSHAGQHGHESRDYALRARAFRTTYTTIPLRVWRVVKGQLQEDAS